MTDLVRKLADAMVIGNEPEALEALFRRETEGLLSHPDPVRQSIGRLFARGYRRTVCGWRCAEESPEACALAMAYVFAQEICEHASGIDDDAVAREAALMLVDGLRDHVRMGLDVALAAKRLRRGGDG